MPQKEVDRQTKWRKSGKVTIMKEEMLKKRKETIHLCTQLNEHMNFLGLLLKRSIGYAGIYSNN